MVDKPWGNPHRIVGQTGQTAAHFGPKGARVDSGQVTPESRRGFRSKDSSTKGGEPNKASQCCRAIGKECSGDGEQLVCRYDHRWTAVSKQWRMVHRDDVGLACFLGDIG